MFDGYVFVDQLPPDETNDSTVCIFTRPCDLTGINPRASVYTTAFLKSIIHCDDKIREKIIVLNDTGLTHSIELPNHESLYIQAFECDSPCLNIVILFEYQNRFTLFSGRFHSSNNILKYEELTDKFLNKQIDELYLDLQTYHIRELNATRRAFKEIVSLIELHEKYKFHIIIDDFGYEHLILALAEDGFKIHFVSSKYHRIYKRHPKFDQYAASKSDAHVILIDCLPPHNEIERQFSEEKKMFITFSTNPESNSPAVCPIKYTINPTLSDIHFIINLAAPRKIYSIAGYSFPVESKSSFLYC